jgi:hypothetical protein
MSKLTEFINGFDISKDKEPVSFSFHSEVGKIIEDNDSDINTTQVDEKVTVPTELILFMP